MEAYNKILFLCFVLLSACGDYSKEKRPTQPLDEAEVVRASSSYQQVKDAVLSQRCTSCHQQYNSYTGVVREIAAISAAVMSGRMPKDGSLSEGQKDILLTWITNGYPENEGEDGSDLPPPELEPNWVSVSSNIIFPKCLACHNPNGQAKFLDLSTRQAFFENRNRIFLGDIKFLDFENAENSYLIQVIEDPEEPMPPIVSNISRLTEQEVQIIKEWILRGLPEIGESK